MRDILPELDRWQDAGEEIALATLVDTHGPSPLPAGARFCCTRTGRMAGSVSGGCIENDVYERAMQVLDDGRAVVQRYGIDDGDAIAVGLSCGGEVDVLIERFEADPAWSAVRRAVAERRAAALCVALSPDRLRGRHLAVLEAGANTGSIDPALDAAVADAARGLLADGGPCSVDVDSGAGPVRVFVEAIAPPPRLFVVGATHSAIALTRMARELGFEVSVIDPRTPFATRERFPHADHLVLEWPDAALDAVDLDSRCHVLTLSHDMKFDVPALARALRSEVRYIGALGSRRTHARRLERLRELGFDERDFERIHTPIGLDIGARTPEEIALAILAEIVAVRRGRAGGPLRERPGRIQDAPDESNA